MSCGVPDGQPSQGDVVDLTQKFKVGRSSRQATTLSPARYTYRVLSFGRGVKIMELWVRHLKAPALFLVCSCFSRCQLHIEFSAAGFHSGH